MSYDEAINSKVDLLVDNCAAEATLTAIKGAGWSTETLKVIHDAIAAIGSIDASDVWSYSGRGLTDKAGFALAAGEYNNIRKSVCLTGDTANSIGKILYDFYVTRLTALRCGYLDNLSAGAAALEATLTAIKGAGWSTETLKVIKDAISALNNITAASVWSVATRALTDKADFTLSTTGIDNIRKSVCLTGDTANSIGKILFDLNAAYTSTRAAYLDYLANESYGLSALSTAVGAVNTDLGDWSARTNLKSLLASLGIPDTADKPLYTCIVTDRLDNGTYGLAALNTAITALNNLSSTTVEGLVENAADGGNLSHNVTVAHGTTETQVVEIAKTGIYALSVYFDLDALETATEGTTITLRLYNKIDGSNYSDKPTAYSTYTIGTDSEYPSFEANMLHSYSKVTIQLESAVTETRNITYRQVTRDLGA